ncbi:VOC family protein [Photorhabdus viridis]|uniref:VOC family protein n=1 Tax=Photorhabdus viridis TaxID=3163327 RepID=UPI0033074898
MVKMHIALRSIDCKKMADFYVNLLGFKILNFISDDKGRFDIYFLSDTEIPKLEIITNWDEKNITQGRTLFHYGFYIENYHEILQCCKKMELPIIEQNTVNDKLQFYTLDPDGNFLEFTES